jgi:hypothetical protein
MQQMQGLTFRHTVWDALRYMSRWSLISDGCGRGIHNVSYSIYTVARSHEENERKRKREGKTQRERERERERENERDWFRNTVSSTSRFTRRGVKTESSILRTRQT